MSKYNSKKIILDGITFHSSREAGRYQELKILEQCGAISDMQLQVPFVLAESVVINGRKKAALRYFADFVYVENGEKIVEDVKGFLTDVYKIKRHLMKSVHGIDILET